MVQMNLSKKCSCIKTTWYHQWQHTLSQCRILKLLMGVLNNICSTSDRHCFLHISVGLLIVVGRDQCNTHVALLYEKNIESHIKVLRFSGKLIPRSACHDVSTEWAIKNMVWEYIENDIISKVNWLGSVSELLHRKHCVIIVNSQIVFVNKCTLLEYTRVCLFHKVLQSVTKC